MTARIYHRDQAGAPEVAYSNQVAVRFGSFKAILKTCLVTGYGALPAAGWELIHEAADSIVLRPATQSGYVCFTLWTSVIRVSVAATFTGVSSGLIVGEGAKSGIASGVTAPQVLYTNALSVSTASTWMLAADDRTFVFCMTSNSGNTNSVSPESFTSTVEYSSLIYAGEDSSGNFITMGGGASTSGGITSPSGAFGAQGMTSLKDPSTGLLVSSSALAAVVPITKPNQTITLLAPAAPATMPHVDLVRINWLVPGHYCGRLRGVAAAAGLCALSTPACLAAVGFSGANTRNLNTPVNFGDSNTWIALARDQRYTPLMFMTDAQEYW